jgi:hypothetical protein
MKEVTKVTRSDPMTTVGEARDWLNDEVLPDKAALSSESTGYYDNEMQLSATWTDME